MIIEVKMCTDICDPYDLWPHISLYYDVTFLENTMYIFIISITLQFQCKYAYITKFYFLLIFVTLVDNVI